LLLLLGGLVTKSSSWVLLVREEGRPSVRNGECKDGGLEAADMGDGVSNDEGGEEASTGTGAMPEGGEKRRNVTCGCYGWSAPKMNSSG